jgi:hypothetical protein
MKIVKEDVNTTLTSLQEAFSPTVNFSEQF